MSFNLHQLINRKQTIYISWLDRCHCDYREIVGVVKDNTNLIDVGDMIEEWTATTLQGSEAWIAVAVRLCSVFLSSDAATVLRSPAKAAQRRGHVATDLDSAHTAQRLGRSVDNDVTLWGTTNLVTTCFSGSRPWFRVPSLTLGQTTVLHYYFIFVSYYLLSFSFRNVSYDDWRAVEQWGSQSFTVTNLKCNKRNTPIKVYDIKFLRHRPLVLLLLV